MQARGGRKKRGGTQCGVQRQYYGLISHLQPQRLVKTSATGFWVYKRTAKPSAGRNTPSTSRLHFLLHLPGSACTSATGSPTCQVCSSRAQIPQRGRRRPSSQRVVYGGNEEMAQTDFFFFYFNYKLLYSSNYLINVQKMNLTYLGSCFSKFE